MNFRTKYGILVAFLLIALLYKLNIVEGKNEEAVSEVKISQEILDNFCEGDLILQQGQSWLSRAIIAIMNEPRPFSHIGMLTIENGEWQVLHTLSGAISNVDGPRLEPLRLFLQGSDHNKIMVLRLKESNPNTLITAAKYYMHEHVPFDMMFDLKDSSRFYCSEFIHHAMKRAGYSQWSPDTFSDGRTYLRYDKLYNGQLTEIIYDGNQVR